MSRFIRFAVLALETVGRQFEVSLVGKHHYGCAAARNQGTCANRRTIRRARLEGDVLGGLREQLLHPDLLAASSRSIGASWPG